MITLKWKVKWDYRPLSVEEPGNEHQHQPLFMDYGRARRTGPWLSEFNLVLDDNGKVVVGADYG
jgi:hypothetical protein